MKIAIGMKLQQGPFGGGNQFGKSLNDFLIAKNIKVVFNLKDKDIDIILLTDPRKWSASCAFNGADALKYLKIKPDAIIVSRINECDERKGHKLKILNKLLLENCLIADKIIFISNWLRQLFIKKNESIENKSQVISNGADSDIFNPLGYQPWNKQEPLRLVTHHWGANWYKGFDVYLYLDQLLEKELRNKIALTFIGKLPNKICFKNIKTIAPLNGLSLAREIKKHHVYLTASINEPAGMHHIEGALCGLPLLYRLSGALPEYANGFGLGFRGTGDIKQQIFLMRQQYDFWLKKMPGYHHTSLEMCQNYYDLFVDLLRPDRKKMKINNINIAKKIIIIRFFALLLKIKQSLWPA